METKVAEQTEMSSLNIRTRVKVQSPETRFLHTCSCVVTTSFGHIPSIEQSKRYIFITVIYNIFTIFYGRSEKCKALYSVNCILVSIVNLNTFALLNALNWARTVSFTQSFSAADLGYGLRAHICKPFKELRNRFQLCGQV
jgi:hypothetical protein